MPVSQIQQGTATEWWICLSHIRHHSAKMNFLPSDISVPINSTSGHPARSGLKSWNDFDSFRSLIPHNHAVPSSCHSSARNICNFPSYTKTQITILHIYIALWIYKAPTDILSYNFHINLYRLKDWGFRNFCDLYHSLEAELGLEPRASDSCFPVSIFQPLSSSKSWLSWYRCPQVWFFLASI